MDNDLNRSLRMLEKSLGFHQNFFLSSSTPKTSEKSKNLKRSDVSVCTTPQHLFDGLSSGDFHKKAKYSKNETSIASLLDVNKSITGSILNVKQPWQTTINSLYVEFFETLQSHSNDHEVFEVVADLARCCSDALQVVQSLRAKVTTNQVDDEIWLENERNTWRLLFVLYQDRISSQNSYENDSAPPYFGTSEKLCILNLFKVDNLLRESQLVIDWLEHSALERDNEALHFTDGSVAWENTLHQLLLPETIVFESKKPLVKSLHPDAPHFEKLSLHDLDVDDDKKLCRRLFQEIRCGKLENAQQLCCTCGHAWRAALLEGWRLYHNPNLSYDVERLENMQLDWPQPDTKVQEKDLQVLEGNTTRDLWKNMAYQYCQKSYLDLHDRAALGAYCGNLQSLLNVCTSWEDYLWAYMKVMVDIRVESEIRDSISKKYKPLPAEYWDQRVSINEIFTYLEGSENAVVRSEAIAQDRIIQKYIILDEIPKLMEIIGEWIQQPAVSTQFLRFASHLVLFLEQIGQSYGRDIYEKILEMYVGRLCEMSETSLVAFYVSKLNSDKQIQIYASYLEKILENEERKQALSLADDSGLNITAITILVVENIRSKPHEVATSGDLQQKITDADLLKISAIDWLLFYKSQLVNAIEQTNALVFTFLTLQKLDAAQLAFNKIPFDAVDEILLGNEATPSIKKIIKEHLSYKVYLDAQESFNTFFKQFNSKPIPPQKLSENAQFTEKVAHEHRESQYKAETERWKLSTAHLSKVAKSKLYNVLLFPDGGWLGEVPNSDYLKSQCITEVFMLLYSVLFQTENFEECVQLADLLADEKHGLYKNFSKEKLGEMLIKLGECSVELLNRQKDPWGSSTSE